MKFLEHYLNEDQTKTPEFKKWFGDSKVVDSSGEPIIVYHGTNKRFSKINMKKGAQGIFWFSSNKKSIEDGKSGAQSVKVIMSLYARIIKPAGWKEYENYSIGELQGLGFDGAILKNKDGSFDGFILEPDQIKSTNNNGTFDKYNLNINEEESIETKLDSLTSKLEKNGIEVSMSYHKFGDYIAISRIFVPKDMRKQGEGTKIMEAIFKFADDNQLTIALSPSTDFGATSKNRLIDFYKRFGFVLNKGRHKDFRLSYTMYRKPLVKEQ